MSLHAIYQEFLSETNLEVSESLKSEFKEIRNFLAGRVSGATRDETIVKELMKVVFCKIHDENKFFENGALFFKYETGDTDFDVYKKVKVIFNSIKNEKPHIFNVDDEINLDPASVRFIVEKLEKYSLVLCKRDAIGDAIEIFFGNQLRGSEGQFFTPRNVIELVVRILNPKPSQKIIDPACGSGGFLGTTINYFKEINGFDGLDDFYMEIEQNLFGIDKDDYLADLAKKHIAILGNCNPNIICSNSLEAVEGYDFESGAYMSNGDFDIVMTNPPFGANINTGPENLRKKYDLTYKWKYDRKQGHWNKSSILNKRTPPQVLFIERCIKLLKDGGKMGIILPESIFSNDMYKYVVNYIVSTTNILAIISLPEELFKTTGKSGTHTKTCVVILEKSKGKTKPDDVIFMAEAKWCGHDSRGLPIPYDDLPKILERYQEAKSRKLDDYNILGHQIKYEEIKNLIFIPKYYDPGLAQEFKRLIDTHELRTIQELVTEGIISISTGDEIGKLSYGTGEIPFVRSSDLSNWEIKVDPKHCVSDEIYDKYREKQDVRPGDILLVKDGTYLVGTTAIVTEYDRKLILQSHIFKIRVNSPELLDPYLFLALLSSEIVQKQVLSKRFSQDIIDTLGKRIYELVIPIPRDERTRNLIIKSVKEVIDSRISARETLRKLKLEVAKP